LVVPYVVDAEHRPIDFKRLDMPHVDACATQGRCGICGGKIRRGPIAFIGPDDPIRHAEGCFADPWMHLECAQLAMQQCPFLAGRRTWRDEEAGQDRVIATYAHNMRLWTATSWHGHRDRLGAWHFQATAGLLLART
jgi:hypothetical protein